MLNQYISEFGVIDKVPHFAWVVFHINQGLFAVGRYVETVLEALASDHSAPGILRSNIGSPFIDRLTFGQRAKAFAQEMSRLCDPRVIADCWQDIKSRGDQMFLVGSVSADDAFVFDDKRNADRLFVEQPLRR